MMMYRTTDTDEILRVLRTKGIWENIGGKSDFEPPITEDYHYLMMVEGVKTAGLWILHPDKDGLRIHANMIPGFRGSVADDAAEAAFEYGFSIADTIYAEIPDEHPNVLAFAEKYMTAVSHNNGVTRLEARA